MLPMSPHDIVKVTERRALEAERRAEVRRLLEEADASSGWPSPLPMTWLLRRAGRLLVTAGRRLQELGAPQRSRTDDTCVVPSRRHTLSSAER